MNWAQGLLNYFQGLQINVPVPKIYGEKVFPLEFLDKLNRFFYKKNIPEERKLFVLEGPAKLWLEMRPRPFINFPECQFKFLSNFHSIEARMKAKTRWQERTFRMADKLVYSYY